MGNSKGGIGIFTSFGFELYVMFFSKQGGPRREQGKGLFLGEKKISKYESRGVKSRIFDNLNKILNVRTIRVGLN